MITLQFQSQLKRLGRNLGVIFQMQDDILEMSTSAENMGKGTSSDIERSKKTILSSMALDQDTRCLETTSRENKELFDRRKKAIT